MNDESPFASFVPSGESPATPKRKSGKKKAAAVAKPKATKPEAVPTKAPRKPRTKKEKKPRTMKVDLTTALVAVAGLTEQDCQVLKHLTTFLSNHPKKSRSRVIAALAKIFA
jgi:hypothetical protein